MPSPQVERILSEYRKKPLSVLKLPGGLSDLDLTYLATQANTLTNVAWLQASIRDKKVAQALVSFAIRFPNLSRLDLSKSSAISDENLEVIANKLPKLQELDLQGCNQVTDEGVKLIGDKLSNLQRLVLWGCNQVTDVGVQALANRLVNLRRLNLFGCDQVTDEGVKAIANKLPNLQWLVLWDCNQVTDEGVKAIANKLPNLERLDLGWCKQVTDAAVIAIAHRLSQLKFLYLGSCYQVTDASVKIIADKVPNLEYLILRHCKHVTDAGVQAIANKLLTVLELDLKDCTRVTDVGVQTIANKLHTLQILYLGDCNRVTDSGVQAIANKLSNLQVLDLTNCTRVTDVGVQTIANKLSNLQQLNLSRCELVTDVGVQAIADKLPRLQQLDLRDCKQVKTLPESVGRLQSLTRLFLYGTSLQSLPVAIQELPLLQYLDVDSVPTLGIPEELAKNPENVAAILEYYFRGKDEGRRTLNEAKLILVGNEAVGKTSLVNYLVSDKPCSETPKTPGVEIVEGVDVTGWDVDKNAAGETPLRLNVWDFGGQQVLYETHQFFLTARSLYLIVLSARKENENEQEANLHAWLRSIRTRTVEDVPVIIVINKSEPPQDLRLDEDRLKREFPVIKRIVRTSCRYGHGIAELRKAIVEVIRAELPHVRDQFPVSYFNVKEQLAKTARQSSILNTDTYCKKCRAENVTEKRDQDNLLELLDRIGVVVRYDNTTLLDPNWLTTAVYRILIHADVVKAGGEFSVTEMGKLLAGLTAKQYSPERWPFIAAMMERFGLSFKLPATSDRYLVPNQFPVNEPDLSGWENIPGLRFRYDYQHTPPRGLLPRFVVATHRYLTNPRIAWLNGVVLGVQRCEVLAKVAPHERRVLIAVRGPKEKWRESLAVVREHFAEVHRLNNLAPGKDVYAKIPVSVPSQPDAAFDFDLLESWEQSGILEVPYPNSTLKFRVKELLAGVGPEPRVMREMDEIRGFAKTPQKVIHIHGNVGVLADQYQIDQLQQENDVSNINVNNSGTMAGVAIGDGAMAEKIITNIRQQLPPNASPLDELKEVIKAALEELTKQKLDEEDRTEAQETVEKIEKEMTKPEPNKDRVSRWVENVEKVSGVVGKVLRGAGAIAGMFS